MTHLIVLVYNTPTVRCPLPPFITMKTLFARIFFFVLLVVFGSFSAFSQLTFRLTAVPSNTPSDATLYIAGSFNGWHPNGTALVLQTDGSYSATVDASVSLIEYKFTRGTWQSVEGNSSGSFLPNRTYNYTGGVQTVNDLQIATWEDLGGSGGSSTANNQVSIIATDFYIPQLDRTRRIWIYLPNDYNTETKNYPVLYMHDGQNLFDAATAFAGEWEIDETLHDLQAMQGDYGAIVVGIDNGGSLRLDEYSPWVNPSYGGGDGDEYVDFLVQTLKPYIDANYRSLTDREHTGIAGSSMGGLISLYAALQYQDIFGKVGVFSPSLWFSDSVFDFAELHPKTQNMAFYFLAGALEGTQMVADMQAMRNLLLTTGFTADEINYEVAADGQHSEWFWAREFGDAYTWLFDDDSTIGIQPIDIPHLARIYPSPADSAITIDVLGHTQGMSLSLYAPNGKLVVQQTLQAHQTLDTQYLPKGIYFVHLLKNGVAQYSGKLAIVHQ